VGSSGKSGWALFVTGHPIRHSVPSLFPSGSLARGYAITLYSGLWTVQGQEFRHSESDYAIGGDRPAVRTSFRKACATTIADIVISSRSQREVYKIAVEHDTPEGAYPATGTGITCTAHAYATVETDTH